MSTSSTPSEQPIRRALIAAATPIVERFDTDYRQWIGVSVVLAGLIAAAINFVQGDTGPATVLLAGALTLLGALMWWTRPSRGGLHISHTSAQAAAQAGDVIVYWRPGCVFCDRLKLGLGADRKNVAWVNILRDPEGAEFVAGHHNGDETIPTVVTGAGELINATPDAIRAQLNADG